MKITGADVIARSLIANGVTHVFNVPGFGIHPLIDAIKRRREQLNYFSGPSETAVALMADGYGRATNRPAFVNVYHASGTALGLVGVTTAWADRSPMLFTTTTTSRKLARSDGYASVPEDITQVTRQFTKLSWEVPSADRIPEAIARAVLLASAPPMGPVHLAFPLDLYTEEVDEAAIDASLLARPDRLQIHGATRADAGGIARAAEMLASAQRPLLVAGGELAQHDAVEELVALSDQLGVPVLGEPYVAYMGFPNQHPRFAGRYSSRHPLVKRADVILMAGTELTGGSGAPLTPPAEAQVIYLSSDVRDFGKQVWADVGLLGHPKASLHALTSALKASTTKQRRDAAWDTEVQQHLAGYRARLAAERARTAGTWKPVVLPQLIDAVTEVFGDDAIVVDHSTTATAYVLEMMTFRDPRNYFGISARASAQGWGGPASIGVQIASPGRRVVTLLGDGGFMFTASTLYAAAQWRLPITFVVLANGGWHDVAYGAMKNRGWTEQDISAFGWGADPRIDYVAFARSLGLRGMCVEDASDLRDALSQARDGEGPALVEVRSDPGTTPYYLSFVSA
jgi:thiamine pyrophosphate-dependent acetolactate synthase large subunit-like protein